jgi:hypothetical protein
VTCQTSGAEVAACVSLAVGLFAGSLIPFFLLVDADLTVPHFVRALPSTARDASCDAAVWVAALLMLLTPAAPKGVTR